MSTASSEQGSRAVQDRGRPGPIFLVGPSRSGTTLLRHILNRHPSVWLTGETFYFDDLRPRLREQATASLDSRALAQCEDFFARVNERRPGSGVDLAEVRRESERIGTGGDAYFEAFCRVRARRRGRDVWGEKTPRHVFRIREILAAFPNARVICLHRDPRAVVASHRDFWLRHSRDARRAPKAKMQARRAFLRSKQQYNLVLTSLLWNATVDAAQEACRRFGTERVTALRFEDLVTQPETCVARLSDWLGIGYQDSMLGVKVANSSYAALDGQEGISSEPLARWRTKLTSADVRVVEMITGPAMRDLGYEQTGAKASPLAVARVFLDVPVDGLQALWVNRHRLSRTFEFLQRRLAPLVARRPGARTRLP